MSDFEVKGAEQFLRLSKALKRAGQTELRKELSKSIRDGAKPLVGKAKAAARAKLPQRGGLADVVSREPVRIQARTGREPGVRIVVGKRRGGARATNEGVIRHPVFGRPGSFVSQPVPGAKDWFDDEMQREAPTVRPDLEKALQQVADEVVRRAR